MDMVLLLTTIVSKLLPAYLSPTENVHLIGHRIRAYLPIQQFGKPIIVGGLRLTSVELEVDYITSVHRLRVAWIYFPSALTILAIAYHWSLSQVTLL